MSKNDFVAMIILNFNKKENVLECLQSVSMLDYPSRCTFVVDNASTDGSVAAIHKEFPKVPILQNQKNLGAAGGKNAGWRYATQNCSFDYLFFLDDDVTLDAQALTKLVNALKNHKKAGLACGKAFTKYPSTTIMSVGITANLYTGSIYDIGSGKCDNGQYDQQKRVAACGGFGMLIKRVTFEALNGFDENYNLYGWEDVDFCFRGQKLGYKTLYVPKAIIYHKGTKVGRKPLPQYERYKIRNYLRLIKRHTNVLQKITCFFCIPIRAMFLIMRLVIQGNYHVIPAQFQGFFESFRKE